MKVTSLLLAATLLVLPTACGDKSSPTATKSPGGPSGQLVTSPPTGAIIGQFVVVGGPAPGDPRPLSGRLTIRGPGGSVVHAGIGADGRFAIQLSPGDYTVTASSKGYDSCGTTPVVTKVVAGQTATADVHCDVP